MFLLVGLGNPGAKYASNRHNIGFMVIDAIAKKNNFPPFRQQFGGLMCRGRVELEDVILLKPNSYMNDSGGPVGAVARFFKLSLSDIWVIHDDLDLQPGRLKVKTGGGTGGHNGLKSIDSHIGRDYSRLRIGIGRPVPDADVSSYVLADFRPDDRSWVDNLIPRIAVTMMPLLNGNPEMFCNRIASSMGRLNGAPKAK